MSLKWRVGERLKKARTELGLTQMDVARKAKVGQDWLCHFEKGRRLPSLQILVQLAQALGVTTDYLLGL